MIRSAGLQVKRRSDVCSGVCAIGHALCVLLYTSVGSPGLAAPRPAWHQPELKQRAIFGVKRGGNEYVLLRTPMQAGAGRAVAAAYTGTGTPLPSRVIHDGRNEAVVLIHYGDRRVRRLVVYHDRSESDPPSRSAAQPIRDPHPVRVQIHARKGNSIPNSWEKLLHLKKLMPKPVRVLHRAVLATGPLTHKPPAADAKPATVIARVTTFVHCPESGVYRFWLRCPYPGFLLINDERIANRSNRHAPDLATPGRPLYLDAGVHRLDVLTTAHAKLDAHVSWQTPGQDDTAPAPIPPERLVAAYEAQHVRVERIDKTLHPGFSHQRLGTYSFRGNPTLFSAVRLFDQSQNWISRNRVPQWRLGREGRMATGKRPFHVFSGPGPHPVQLTIRDELGFTATLNSEIRLEETSPRQYRLHAELRGIPPACYADDSIMPVLGVHGSVPRTRVLIARCDVQHADGRVSSVTQKVAFVRNRFEIKLNKMPVSDVRAIDWRIEHAGVTLFSSNVRFVRPPLVSVPARISGDRLYDADGTRLVVVPARHHGEVTQPVITTEQAFGTLLCIDDALIATGDHIRGPWMPFEKVLARIVDGPDRPIVRYHRLPDWRESPHAYGPMLKLSRIVRALGEETDVAVLCLGLQDALRKTPPDEYERLMAALCDILVTGVNRPVVLCTPPPIGEDPSRIREYAAAVRRVADARDIPVADLYSAFRGRGNPQYPLIDGHKLALTESGHQLTARVIARALLSE